MSLVSFLATHWDDFLAIFNAIGLLIIHVIKEPKNKGGI